MTDEEFIRAAIEVIRDPEHWCRHYRHLGTHQHCMLGALEMASKQWTSSQFDRVVDHLISTINELYERPEQRGYSVATFNDHYATHEDVIAVMEKTAAKLAEHGD
jgi:hypothetical protein